MSTPTGTNGLPPGLSAAEAASRLVTHGPNSLPVKAGESMLAKLLRQFSNPLIYILLAALAVDLVAWWREGAHGWPVESIAIGTILLLNSLLGMWQESKAESALARLKQLAAPKAWTMRDGVLQAVPAADLVPGDVVRVEAGDRVPADGVLHGSGLSADEAILTGESLPVDKVPGGEILSGTLIMRGRSFAEVTRTGPRSALGRLAGMIESVKEEATPLERRLEAFGKRVAVWVLVLCAALVLQGVLTQGMGELGRVFLFAVALAVAAVPEGLPAILTLTLALGVERMAARRAVVRKLSAVEALGSVTAILTDKTGTITENKLEVLHAYANPGEEAEMHRAVALANDADGAAGDPLDCALVAYVEARGLDVKALRASLPRHSSIDFDSERKFQRVTVRRPDGGLVSYVKGAPEVILSRTHMSEAERGEWLQKAEEAAVRGERVIGVARGDGERETGLQLAGLISFWDPPRPEVAEALANARSAGISVTMVTGDHPATALAIAAKAGFTGRSAAVGEDIERATQDTLPDTQVYARVRPEHKLKLVELHQARGEVVAMTGDGVNDAPALKRSDIGVAMGLRGSDVSREVADIVLLDDNFATIVAAVEEGRGIYENTQKFIRFLFSTNLAEVIVVAGGMLLSTLLALRDETGAVLLPLTAVQILWINLVTDGLPALALALDRNPGVMNRPPRPASAPLLDPLSLRFVIGAGTMKGLIALGLLGLSYIGFMSTAEARTAAFQFLAIGQLFFAYPSRHTDVTPLPNFTLHAAVALGVALQVLVGIWPAAAHTLDLAPLSAAGWAIVFGASAVSWMLAEVLNRMLWRPRA